MARRFDWSVECHVKDRAASHRNASSSELVHQALAARFPVGPGMSRSDSLPRPEGMSDSKTILITGASSGIGLAAARQLAAVGAKVIGIMGGVMQLIGRRAEE